MSDLEDLISEMSEIPVEISEEQPETILFVNEPTEGLKMVFDAQQKPRLMYLGKSEQWGDRDVFWYSYQSQGVFELNRPSKD